MDRNPLFSIIIPTYNRAAFIESTIRKLQNQKFTDFEIVIVDDGSVDGTKSIVEKIEDSRIVYTYIKNGERGAARNKGVSISRGDYVTFLDSDDELLPHFLQTAYDFISENEEIPIFHIAYEVRDSNGKVLSKVILPRTVNHLLVEGNPLSCIGILLRRDVAVDNPFSEQRQLAGSEDWVLWLKLASRFAFPHIPTISAYLIQHDERSVMRTDVATLEKRIQLAGELVMKDGFVTQKFSGKEGVIWAHLYLYVALHGVLAGSRKTGLRYVLKATQKHWPSLFTTKVLVIFAKLF
ncbi:glycosyltransferase [uncultured Imperialibacter sp.]|uniref:glycosyltransferase family 2 protein n=1 Tax=uncultured Imperialibacter sp. TaxID=1672639 RepID=UPI0030D7FF6E|tara:strand:- start:8862 stop:9743 length:882 start_codon:yes stop_codon:yes gene_type:complete